MESTAKIEELPLKLTTTYGRARQYFSDKYSVFNWGDMPDQIPNKGAATAILSAFFFESLGKKDLQTHYLGLFENKRVRNLKQLGTPTNAIEIGLFRTLPLKVTEIDYDYSSYQDVKSIYRFPFKIIYRNHLSKKSNILKRQVKEEIILEGSGFDGALKLENKLETPFLEFVTTLESDQRYIDWEEASKIAGLQKEELSELRAFALFVNDVIVKAFFRIGVVVENGKLEIGFDQDRRLTLLNAAGTLEENRLTLEGFPIGLELAEIFYSRTQWGKEVVAQMRKNPHSWRQNCRSTPPSLPSDLVNIISNLYCACANEITKKKWFSKTPPLGYLSDQIKDIFKR